MADDKPFECTQPGCGMRFTNEDHLIVHQAKHEMSLSLTSGTTRTGILTFVADQTPTPSKFLKNCEEIGLFHELSKNPFEEAFKKASEDSKNLELNERQSTVSSVVEADDVSAVVCSLNTPTPRIVDSLTDVIKSASKSMGQDVEDNSHSASAAAAETDHHTELIPLPGPNIETESTIDNTVSTAQPLAPVISTVQTSTCAARAVLVAPTLCKRHHHHQQQQQEEEEEEEADDTDSQLTPASRSEPTSNVCYIQVMLQSADGDLLPVNIPATVVHDNNTHLSSSSSSSSSRSSCSAAVPVTSGDAVTSSGVTLTTKQKLKAAIQHNNMNVMSDAVDFVTANQSSSIHRSTIPVCTASSVIRIPGQQVELQDADTSTPSVKKCRQSSSDDDADEKRRLFLERNRAAAARCRNKKKLWMNSLEQKADNITAANSALQAEVLKLRQELARLKSLMLFHRDCPVTRQHENIMSAVRGPETSCTSCSVMHVVSDEAIAMDALSKMADCVSSSSDSQLQSVHSVIDLSAASTT